MLRKVTAGMLLVAGLALSAGALAQEAYTTRQSNVRAGPDTAYPVVAVLGAGSPVDVVGCVGDYLWCDVIFGDNRGWVSSRALQYVYQSRRVPLYEYGATLGLPILGFSLFNYWDDHYRSRSFYRDRPRWQNAPHAHWNDHGPRDNNWRDRGPRDNNWRDRQPQQAQPQYIPQRPEPQYRQPQPQYRQPDQQFRPDRQRGQNQPQPQAQVQPQMQQTQSQIQQPQRQIQQPQPQVQQPQAQIQQPRQPQPDRPAPAPRGYVSPQSIQPDVTGGN